MTKIGSFPRPRRAVHPHFCLRLFGGATLALSWLAVSVAQGQTTNVGASSLLVGPAAGTNSVALVITPQTVAWTATANANWLQLSTAGGQGSTNVIFTFSANTTSTRSGTLTIAGQTLSITQAG